MTASTKNQKPPDTLFEILDGLDAPTLRTVRTYVDERLDDLRPPLQEQVRSEANEEIVDIKDCGAYTLVSKYSPSQGTAGRSPQPLSLYRVKRERQLNGEETLHWSYLGDVADQSEFECGASSDTRRTVRTHCGEETSHRNEGV